MDTNTATQLSNEFESALSKTLPDLYELLQLHQVSETIHIVLDSLNPDSLPIFQCIRCTYPNNCVTHPCGSNPTCAPTCDPLGTDGISGSELSPDKVQQFCTDLASTLSTIFPRLSESVRQTDESFKAHILIEPAAVSCKLVDGVLLCSNQPQ